ncbi:MAG: hypothetical protein M1542_03030 [Thermotogae bacterium]|jgi:hypothetical protein|nr:hypothetical protein [Thermotogota bacterium]MCL5032211.1 hypothetical protein [Thermotogota bacterium]
MKEIESFIFEILEEHPSTEENLTKAVSGMYPICIFFCRNNIIASSEVRIALANLIEKDMINICFGADKAFLTIKTNNQRFEK